MKKTFRFNYSRCANCDVVTFNKVVPRAPGLSPFLFLAVATILLLEE